MWRKMRKHSHLTRLLGACATAALCAGLVAAPSVGAAGDPVAAGHLDLALSPELRAQLKKKRTWVKLRGLSIEGGTVDPLSGSGSLELGGTVKFRHRGKRVVFGKLSATLGSGGVLRGSVAGRRGVTAIFRLDGGSVVRNGFGAEISGVRASFARPVVKRLKRKLGVRLPAGSAGSLAVSTQPETVEVLGGMATVNQDLSPGGIADKLRAHCIDPVDGVSPSGAATQPGGPGTPFQIPVSGGTISPNGWTAGVVQLAGGLDVEVGGPGLPVGCPTTPEATIHFSNLAVDVARKSLSLHLTVSGPSSPFSGVLPVELAGDTGGVTFSADPVSHTLTAGGAALRVNDLTAWGMNAFLPHPGGTPSTQFAVGDLFGSEIGRAHV